MPATKVARDSKREPSQAEMAAAVAVERLICVDCDDNNNKFWHGFALANGDFFCEYGRVDKTRMHDYFAYGDVALAKKKLEQKANEKLNYSGDKEPYTRQKTIAANGPVAKTISAKPASTDLKSLATQQIKGDPETQKLVAWLAEVNVHQITAQTTITYNVASGTFSTPLGLVTPDGITEARNLLGDIDDYVDKHDWDNPKYKSLLSNYLRIVPQQIPSTRGWHRTLFAAPGALTKQNDILDSLEAALMPSGGTQTPGVATPEQVFNVRLVMVNDPAILKTVRQKFTESKNSDHYAVYSMKLHALWTVEISTVRSAFQADGMKVGNIQQLWHGTKASNVLSILKGGLIIPPYNKKFCAGRNYGNGVYFSDQSTKSLQYATGFWVPGGNTERKFMFIADVAMGKSYVPKSGVSTGANFDFPPGYDSTFAKGGVSGVTNNEMIVYRTSQADLTYLCEFRN